MKPTIHAIHSTEKAKLAEPNKVLLEDEFFNLQDMVSIKREAAERSLKQVLAEMEELIRDKKWEDAVALFYPVAEKLPDLAAHGLLVPVREKIGFILGQRIETVFITPTGRYRARLAIDEHRHVSLRTAQYLKLSDAPFALKTAIAIVSGKIDNMYRLLLLRARQYQENELRNAATRLTALKANVAKAEQLEILRGFEGAATRIYFNAFKWLIRNDAFVFNGRNKRPPLDPVNAMLSFVYTLLTNEVLSAVKVSGLDPYIGSLHEIS